MNRLSFLLIGAMALLPTQMWGKHAGTVSCDPDPARTDSPVTITIKTANLGTEVYLHSWLYIGDKITSPTDWNSGLVDKFLMKGSGGQYTFTIEDLGSFYNLTEDDLSKLTQIGLLARSRTDQTEDMSIDVVYVPNRIFSGGGTGTAKDPFKLASAEDMNLLNEHISYWNANQHFALSTDIELPEFAGIGTSDAPFISHFDGQGHVIKNLTITGDKFGTPTGLFNYTDGAEITRVGVVGATVNGRTYTGILVGKAHNTHISQCYTTGTVEADGVCLGGIAGDLSGTSILEDCYSTAEVQGDGSAARGGIVGRNSAAVKRTWSMSPVSGIDFCGSVAGANYGNIEASAAISPSIEAEGNFVGKFAGNTGSEGYLNSYAWSNTSASGSFGHHAGNHSHDMTQADFYKSTLDWDFDNVWEWVNSDGKEFALLRGLQGQALPQHDAFFNEQTGDVTGVNTNALGVRVSDDHIITGKDCYLTIFSATGITMMQRNIESSIPVSIAHLQPGVYMLLLTDGANESITLKIVKK